MDRGNSVHTTINMSNPEIATYMVQHKLFNTCMGLVHSHHDMGAFFSGEDKGTLYSEGMDMNNFLSLVVDNKGTYVAAITRRVTKSEKATVKKTVETSYPVFNTEEVVKENKVINTTSTNTTVYVEYIELEIVKSDNIKPDYIVERFATIYKRPSTDSVLAQKTASKYPYTAKDIIYNYPKFEEPTLFEDYENNLYNTDKYTNKHTKNEPKYENSKNEPKDAIEEFEELYIMKMINGQPILGKNSSSINAFIQRDNLKYIAESIEVNFNEDSYSVWLDTYISFLIDDFASVTGIEDYSSLIKRGLQYVSKINKIYKSGWWDILKEQLEYYK